MDDFGDIVCKSHEDGTVTVERADELVGISTYLLGQQPWVVATGGAVDDDGLLVIDTAGEYRYRPTRFAHNGNVVVCERVR